MNRVKIVGVILSIVFTAFMVRILSLTKVGEFLFQVPSWVYLIYAGVVFCGYKAVQSFSDERRKERVLIEQEGEMIMKKVREERSKRKLGS
ncbi:sporulation YhaL family protein [Alteribacter populi]|uniref:sporulation YhaL family protein n=1 Tax=Alteribacter populi TaxID=2011011 RepID=UPI000BBA7FA7|nr:sporulation YhaL family protein [Alteribacter populi]